MHTQTRQLLEQGQRVSSLEQQYVLVKSLLDQRDAELQVYTEAFAEVRPNPESSSTKETNNRSRSEISQHDVVSRPLVSVATAMAHNLDKGGIIGNHNQGDSDIVRAGSDPSKKREVPPSRGESAPGKKAKGKIVVTVNELGEVCVGDKK
jgi:hypothetical protein